MLRGDIGAEIPFPVPDQIATLLVSCIFEAHQRTCLQTIEQIREQWEVGVEQSKVDDFMRMVGFCPLSVNHGNDSLNIFSPARTCGVRLRTS